MTSPATSSRQQQQLADVPADVFGVVTEYCLPSSRWNLKQTSATVRRKVLQACEDRWVPILVALPGQPANCACYKYFWARHAFLKVGIVEAPQLRGGGGPDMMMMKKLYDPVEDYYDHAARGAPPQKFYEAVVSLFWHDSPNFLVDKKNSSSMARMKTAMAESLQASKDCPESALQRAKKLAFESGETVYLHGFLPGSISSVRAAFQGRLLFQFSAELAEPFEPGGGYGYHQSYQGKIDFKPDVIKKKTQRLQKTLVVRDVPSLPNLTEIFPGGGHALLFSSALPHTSVSPGVPQPTLASYPSHSWAKLTSRVVQNWPGDDDTKKKNTSTEGDDLFAGINLSAENAGEGGDQEVLVQTTDSADNLLLTQQQPLFAQQQPQQQQQQQQLALPTAGAKIAPHRFEPDYGHGSDEDRQLALKHAPYLALQAYLRSHASASPSVPTSMKIREAEVNVGIPHFFGLVEEGYDIRKREEKSSSSSRPTYLLPTGPGGELVEMNEGEAAAPPFRPKYNELFMKACPHFHEFLQTYRVGKESGADEGKWERFDEKTVCSWSATDWRQHLTKPFLVKRSFKGRDPEYPKRLETFTNKVRSFSRPGLRLPPHPISGAPLYLTDFCDEMTQESKYSDLVSPVGRHHDLMSLMVGRGGGGGDSSYAGQSAVYSIDQDALMRVYRAKGIGGGVHTGQLNLKKDPQGDFSYFWNPKSFLSDLDTKDGGSVLYNRVVKPMEESGEVTASAGVGAVPFEAPWFIVGTSGSWCPEHKEPSNSNTWAHLKSGTKIWFLQEVEGGEWKGFEQVEGETVFLPPTTRHVVVNQTNTLSISRNFHVL